MTTYAYDASTGQLVAVWDTGIGATLHPVARLNAATPQTVGLQLAYALTHMSDVAWLSYSSPKVIDIPVAAVRGAMRRPNVPRAGLLRVDEHPVVECAHAVGRILQKVGSAGASRAVTADVEDEIAAVGNADRGDLAGRAQQAVMLTRLVPSPEQISVADRLLHDAPMGSPRLYTDVDSAAASVAALHWFLAAVTVVVTLAETTGEEALEQAEHVQQFDPAVPRAVLRLATSDDGDCSPLGIVCDLLQAAVLASHGLVWADRRSVPEEPRFTVLDPKRPARCLLNGLIGGLQALGALHATYLDTDEEPGCDEVEWLALARKHFDAAVRAEAAARAPERLAEVKRPRT
jgi:hypothetical protein